MNKKIGRLNINITLDEKKAKEKKGETDICDENGNPIKEKKHVPSVAKIVVWIGAVAGAGFGVWKLINSSDEKSDEEDEELENDVDSEGGDAEEDEEA